jgi:hypothetical protein
MLAKRESSVITHNMVGMHISVCSIHKFPRYKKSTIRVACVFCVTDFARLRFGPVSSALTNCYGCILTSKLPEQVLDL